jgi:hypothetical protein
MKESIQLVRKDVRHLWPWILVFWALLALVPVTELWRGRAQLDFWVLLTPQPAIPLSLFFLVATAIHHEGLVGDSQYWLSRPFTAWHLVASKALLFALFINVPVLLMQAVMLKSASMPILESLPALFWRQLFFTAAFTLPYAAIAAVTRSMGQTVLVTLAAYFVLATILNTLFDRGSVPGWGDLAWIRAAAFFASAGAGSALALLLQYTRRRTLVCRLLLLATAALMFAVWAMPPSSAAVAIQTALSPERVDGVTIGFDSIRVRQAARTWVTSPDDPAGIRVEIPIQIGALEPDSYPIDDWTRLCIDLPEGGTWCSDWLARTRSLEIVRFEPWLRAAVDRVVFERVKNTPVRLYGSVAYTLLRPTGAVPINALNSEAPVPGAGRCIGGIAMTNSVRHVLMSACDSPHADSVLAAVTKTAGSLTVGDVNRVYAPFPVNAWLKPWETSFGPSLAWPIDRAQPPHWLIVKPVAHLRREFDFAGVRLADYAQVTP